MYQVQKQSNEYFLVEMRNDDIPPVILDTLMGDRELLETMIGRNIEDSNFELIELPIHGYEGTFHTVAKIKR